jgi:hypothetical protein
VNSGQGSKHSAAGLTPALFWKGLHVSAVPFILVCSIPILAGMELIGCASSSPGNPGESQETATTEPSSQRRYSSNYEPAPEVGPGWREKSVALPQPQTSVAQGPAPLVYLLDIGAPIRVVDMTSSAVIAQATAPNGSIIRVDPRRGVMVGSQNVLPGPLPADHRYEILIEPTTPGVMRQRGP